MAEEYASSQDKQREITEIMYSNGAIVYNMVLKVCWFNGSSTRLGLALGVHQVETAISANAVVLTTIVNGNCQTFNTKNC
ncbi:hypothetical protein ACVXG7_10700 [Enterobacter hormaechei]